MGLPLIMNVYLRVALSLNVFLYPCQQKNPFFPFMLNSHCIFEGYWNFSYKTSQPPIYNFLKQKNKKYVVNTKLCLYYVWY